MHWFICVTALYTVCVLYPVCTVSYCTSAMCVLGPVSQSAGNQHQEERLLHFVVAKPATDCHTLILCVGWFSFTGVVYAEELVQTTTVWDVYRVLQRLGRLPGFATFGTFTGFTTGYQVYAEYTVYTVWHIYDCLPDLHRLARLRLVTTGYQVYTDYTVYNVYSVYRVYADWNVYNVYNIYDWLRQRLLNCPIWQSCLGYTWGVFYIFKLSTRHWDFCYELASEQFLRMYVIAHRLL